VLTRVIWFQTVKRSAISCRHPVADSRCRRGRKCGEMWLNTDRNRCACRGEVNRFHRPLALPGRLMRVLGPIVQILRLPVFHRGHHHAVGRPVAGELVGDKHPRHVPQSQYYCDRQRALPMHFRHGHGRIERTTRGWLSTPVEKQRMFGLPVTSSRASRRDRRLQSTHALQDRPLGQCWNPYFARHTGSPKWRRAELRIVKSPAAQGNCRPPYKLMGFSLEPAV
jgi:hypothetical protein